jgi:hypothetical protein
MAVGGPLPLRSAGRAAMHVVAIVLGWALFVFGWLRVASVDPSSMAMTSNSG